MIKKPKIHPKYGTKLVGINFRERWNVVQYATKDELEKYIANVERIKKTKRDWSKSSSDWWSKKQAIINEKIQNLYLRKVWRKRHSESFKTDVLYRVDRTIARWNQKLAPKTGNGLAISYHFERDASIQLLKGDIIVLTKVDELGNLYFSKINELSAPHPYVFNRENAQLGWILPVET